MYIKKRSINVAKRFGQVNRLGISGLWGLGWVWGDFTISCEKFWPSRKVRSGDLTGLRRTYFLVHALRLAWISNLRHPFASKACKITIAQARQVPDLTQRVGRAKFLEMIK